VKSVLRCGLAGLIVSSALLLPLPSAGATVLGVSGSAGSFKELKPDGFTLLASFEAWSNARDAATQLNRAKRAGARPMITWEPWRPPPLGSKDQGKRQPAFTNASIAAGRHDRYIRAFARSISEYRKPVLLRYAHEFPGDWYPWSNNAAEYKRAWRRIHRLFRREGARNAQFVWAPQMSGDLVAATQPYWPGSEYVDRVATTFIYFGAWQGPPQKLLERIGQLRRFGKRALIAEANSDYGDRYEVLQALADYLKANPWIESLTWTQTVSRAEHDWADSELGWPLAKDKRALGILKTLR
jgi:hypothetical protein